MDQIKIGWLGDSQLDYAQYGLIRRRDDFIAAMDSALADMRKQGITTVVHAGDFLQSNRPSPWTMSALQEMQRWLIQENMVVLVVSGNHDNARPHWINIINAGGELGFQLIDNVLLNSDGVNIYGLPNMGREDFLKAEFKPADVLVMHQSVTQFIDFPTNNGIDVTELPFDKYQVIAIGDIHIYRIEPIQQLLPEKNVQFNCIVGYAGATELNSESESDIKYWIELVFNKTANGVILDKWVPHEIKARPIIRLKIEDISQLDRLVDETKFQVDKLKEHDIRAPLIFIRYNPTVPGVIERFRKNFDPDEFILRFHPVFRTEKETAVMGAAAAELSINDLLKKEVPESSALYPLASQLFNPDMEPDHINASIDAYIEERLNNAELPTD